MAYLTRTLLQTRVGGVAIYLQLTDDDRDSAIDAAVEDYLLAETDATVDSYLSRGGYAIPLADAQGLAMIRPYLLDVANYKAKSRGGRLPAADDVKAYEAALAWLELVATGKIILPGWTGAAIAVPLPWAESDEAKMTARRLRGY